MIIRCIVCSLICGLFVHELEARSACNPIYVRWPRVKLSYDARVAGPYSLNACQGACTAEENPTKSGSEMQCSGFNHRTGTSIHSPHCQIYQADQLQHVDGYIEADDRYSLYWKYCLKSDKGCTGNYAFTFFSDRYMDSREVTRTEITHSLEDCLSLCLDESSFSCRSISFNRTDGGCHLSKQTQLSRPNMLKLNNNPNFRIDYYENGCFNNSYLFDYECKDNGFLVNIHSTHPYTGALYGLYDFFSCRIEPKDAYDIQYLFPFPSVSKNCSDSIRHKGSDTVLEVVLSTDGVEPLYFITPDDLTYQATCPFNLTGQLNRKALDPPQGSQRYP
ncbi:hypothetical protein AB6A40_006349 [Gnathostoma spinigerum]|uniref:Uncharacterized protein n=1 Tax=Gnathostoma spinigerum TaxID=75299 RepID=A0ABD6EI49_9BILA